LQPVLDGSEPGAAFCLEPGDYAAPLQITEGRTVWGPSDAVIRSSGEGTTVRLEGRGAVLLGVTVDGSGGRFDLLDAAVHVSGADARVEGVHVRNATFGILVERAERATLLRNLVVGKRALPFGLRGDGIRLWEAHDCRIEENVVSDSRDMVLWYASRNRVRANRVEAGRYGAHLMYSHDNEIAGNRFVANVTGVFLMYSRNVDVRRNLFAASGGAAGIGLGIKESGNLRVVDNAFVRDSVGIYIDASPLWPDDRNLFERNVFHLNDVSVSFLTSQGQSEFTDNDFHDARMTVEVSGGGDARKLRWQGNYFDDYAGYDLDRDGVGDVAYELRSLASDLISERPALAFYRGTPALVLAETIGRIVPVVEPRVLLVDPAPRMSGRAWGGDGAD
jgi:nitrous oxidase accessory protein